MRTPKKIREAIVKRVKSWRGSPTAKGAVMEEPRTSDMPKDVKDSLDVKEQTNADKATETGTRLCENINENSEDLNIPQPTRETSEKAQNSSIETPNATDSSSLAVCFDGDATDKKDNPSTKTTQQRQAILAGFIGTALLVSSVALCIMEMHVVAVRNYWIGLCRFCAVQYHKAKYQTRGSREYRTVCLFYHGSNIIYLKDHKHHTMGPYI